MINSNDRMDVFIVHNKKILDVIPADEWDNNGYHDKYLTYFREFYGIESRYMNSIYRYGVENGRYK